MHADKIERMGNSFFFILIVFSNIFILNINVIKKMIIKIKPPLIYPSLRYEALADTEFLIL